MKVETVHPETGETITVEISEEQFSELSPLAEDRLSRKRVDSYIDNLDISADAKQIISSVLEVTISVGSQIIKVGQRIVEFVLAISNQFPNATFGLVLGLLLGVLVSSVPLLGGLFGSLVMPLAAAFGLAMGYMDDVRDKALVRKIEEAATAFRPLNG